LRLVLNWFSTCETRSPGDGRHHGAFEAELLVVLVVGLVDELGTAAGVAVGHGREGVVEQGVHRGGDFAPGRTAASLRTVLLLSVQLLALGLGLGLESRGVVAGTGQTGGGVELSRRLVDRGGQSFDPGAERVAAVSPQGDATQLGELLAVSRLHLGAEVLGDRAGQIGRDVVGVERPGDGGGGPGGVARGMLGDGARQICARLLGHLRPGGLVAESICQGVGGEGEGCDEDAQQHG
jgi:hypothetical protein